VRPALDQLRDDIAAGKVDRVYVHSPDRLARKYAYQVLLMEEWQRSGAAAVFLHEPPDAGPEQTLLRQMQGMIAEYERAQILERSRRGKRHRARCGEVGVFSSAPYGYRYVPRAEGGGKARWEVIEEEARVVRRIFDWVAMERATIRDVCHRLAEAGVPSRNGTTRWLHAYVGRILRNPAYIGQAAFGRTRPVPPVRMNRARPGKPEIPRGPLRRFTDPSDWIRVSVPALVSEEVFAAVQEQMDENRRRVRARRGPRRLLQGLLVCRRCGYAYVGTSNGGKRSSRKYYYYRCNSVHAVRPSGTTICTNRSVAGALLDNMVWKEVRALLESPSRIETEHRRRLDEAAPHESRQLEELKGRLRALSRALQRIIDGYAEGFLAKQEVEPRIRDIKERRAQVEREMRQVQDREAQVRELRLVTGRLADFANRVQGGLDTCGAETRKELVRTLVKRVEIDENEVKVIFRVGTVPFDRAPRNPGGVQHCLPRVLVDVRDRLLRDPQHEGDLAELLPRGLLRDFLLCCHVDLLPVPAAGRLPRGRRSERMRASIAAESTVLARSMVAAPNPRGTRTHARTLLVRTAVRRLLVVHPVRLFPAHPLASRHLPRRPRPVERAALGAVAERLAPVAALRGVPVVDDHLDRHLAAPDA